MVNKAVIKAVQKSSPIYKGELSKTRTALEKLENERKKREKADRMHQQTLREDIELLVNQRDLQKQQKEVNVLISDDISRLQAASRKKDSISIEGGNVQNKSISK